VDFSSSIGRQGRAASHDSRIGHGYGSVGKSKSGLGSERPLYNKAYEPEIEYPEEEEYFADEDIRSKIRSIISPYDITAIGVEPQRKDMLSLANSQLIGEKHTTTARGDISPFSHRQLYPNGTGPVVGTGNASQAFRTTGNFRQTGSEKGYVSPHQPLTDIDDENIFNLDDMLSPVERAFRRQQISVKNTLKKINECLRDN
tara:strand:+ start:410 stop:1012 length:603 start_codon:yes stop_codon:yes gene_type:complete